MKILKPNDPMLIALGASEDKLCELTTLCVSRQEQLDKLLENLREMRGKTDAEDRLDAEAAALRIGSDPEGKLVVKRIDELQHELEVIDRAIEQQKLVVDQARRPVSIEINRLNAQEYIASAKRIVDAEHTLSAAYAAHKKLVDDLLVAGAPRRPMYLPSLGTLDDPNSVLSAHRREFEMFVPEALN